MMTNNQMNQDNNNNNPMDALHSAVLQTNDVFGFVKGSLVLPPFAPPIPYSKHAIHNDDIDKAFAKNSYHDIFKCIKKLFDVAKSWTKHHTGDESYITKTTWMTYLLNVAMNSPLVANSSPKLFQKNYRNDLQEMQHKLDIYLAKRTEKARKKANA